MNPEMRVCAPPLWFILFIINFIIVIIPISITAQQSSNNNVTPGSSIVAKADGSPAWTSPSGEFAFGFRKVAGGGFLLAIWFDRLPDKTIVWSANRNNPVSSGSRIQLSLRGTLELIDERGQPVWSNQPQSGTVAFAAMLDTGNFVLTTNTSKPLWESFDEPTDTMLPGQTLRGNIALISSFSETNYTVGRFSFAIKGNVAGLRTRNFPWNDSIYDYWLSPVFQSQMIFNQSGNAYAAEENGTMINPLFVYGTVPIDDFLQRLTLEYDGVLRHYVYPKSANRTEGRTAAAWSVHDFIPPNICMGVASGGNGGGICGFNSLCTLAAGRTKCQCPKGYSLIDPADRLSGCKPDFALQSCDPQSNDADQFEFAEFLNTNWPYADYRAFEPVDEDYCRRDCLADCFCALMTYAGDRCWKKALPFINGRTDPGIPEKALVKVRKNNTISGAPTTTKNSHHSQSTALVIAGSVLMACSVTLFLISSVLLFVYCSNMRRSKMIPEARVHPAGITTMRSYSFMELQEATNGFKEILGKGAYSTVYRGALTDTGKFVAVKKLHKVAKEADLEFIAEVSSISRTNHKNLLQLLGYCDEGHNRILVYELMANGSLATFLFQKSPRPNWYTRVQIAFATARALCYLHEECSVPIIHCDIKPQNVLLDECLVPKIADFGLAKLMKPDQTGTTTEIRGTRGYVAPEWFRNMPITAKVDVYSFGILLLELLCCRKHYEADLEDDGEAVLADWAYDCYQQGVLDLLVGDDKEARSDIKMFEILVKTAIWCIQEDPTLRPNMKRVMHMLEGSIQVPAPPDPTTFIS